MSLTQINKAGLDEIALDHVFTIGASGSSAYTFQGEGLNGTVNNPTLYLTRGKTYRFENGSGGHPIRIQSTSGASGTAYNTGVTNNAGSGTVIVEVQHDAPDVLYYQCTSHAAMNGILYITGALADGGVTTAKIADDAVNNDKLANSVVASIAANTAKTSNATHTGDVTGSTSLTIANDAVTTAKIADNAVTRAQIVDGAINGAKCENQSIGAEKLTAGTIVNNNVSASANIAGSKLADDSISLAKLQHGTSSNNGKFLRANNGADPTFETVTGTTINNNADNRVITGSGTANTLNGQSGFTVNTSNNVLSAGGGFGIQNVSGVISGSGGGQDYINVKDSGNTERLVVKTHGTGIGNVGIGTTSPTAKLHVDTSHYVPTSSGTSTTGIHLDGNPGNAGEYGGGISFGCGNSSGSAAAIAARQGTSDSDVIGMSFFTHDSSTGTADAVEKVRIHDGGAVSFNNGIILGNGLSYNSANLMNDYEEGSYTVSVQGDSSVQLSYTYRQANYVKIGKYVFVAFDVRGSRNNMNGQVYMSLPFTSMASGGTAGGGACNVWAIGTSSHYGIHVQVDNNTGYAYFTYQWSNNNTSGLTGNLFYSNTQLRGQFAYIAAS